MNYKELSSAFKRINKWYTRKTKVLSIRTRPFNSFEVFSNIITKVLNDNGLILYIWCSKEENYIHLKNQELYESILQDRDEGEYKGTIESISIENIKNASNQYDLVIIDDISMFSKYSNEYIIDAVEEIYWRSNKIIVYSSDYVFPIGERMDLAYLISKDPILEPRLLNTRIRLEENIPLALFDYFKWFKKNRRRVIVVVPNEEKLNKVYNHYYSILKEIDIRVIKYEKTQEFNNIEDILNGYSESLFIITNIMGEYIKNIDDVNVILLFADDIYYSYKKIIYTCGAIESKSDLPSEVIMVSKEVSEEMDKARSITRMFNRKLWEKNYLEQ